jgi:hypothetical protein
MNSEPIYLWRIIGASALSMSTDGELIAFLMSPRLKQLYSSLTNKTRMSCRDFCF